MKPALLASKAHRSLTLLGFGIFLLNLPVDQGGNPAMAESPLLQHEAASTTSLLTQGYQALKSQAFMDAYRAFDHAANDDPNDPEVRFLLGLTLNRLERFPEAQIQLEKAQILGYTAPAIMFELGWAYLGQNRYHAAKGQFQNYLVTDPNRAQAHEFLGRAQLGLGEYAAASASFDQAESLDARLAPTITLYRAQLANVQGNKAEAGRQLQLLLTQSSTIPVSRAARDQFDRLSQQRGITALESQAPKPLRFSLMAAFGYNSNVIAASDDLPLPAGISNQESATGQFAASVAYDVHRSDTDLVTVGSIFSANIYESQLNDADDISAYLYTDYSHRLNENLAAGIRVSGDFLWVGGLQFRSQFTARPRLSYRINPNLNAEAYYSFTLGEYHVVTASAATNRDSFNHLLGTTLYFRIPDTQFTGKAGLYHQFQDAEGGDFDLDATGLFAGLRHPLIFDITGEVTYTHVFGNYRQTNSFAGFAFARDDDTDVVNLLFTRPITPDITAFLRYDFISNFSNIVAFKYDQHVVFAGLIWNF